MSDTQLSNDNTLEWIDLLNAEIENLDRLVSTTKQLNDHLNNREKPDTPPNLEADLQQIMELAKDVQCRRKDLTSRLQNAVGEPANLTQLIKHAKPEYQSQLKQLREQMHRKLSEIQTISYSNQVVLNYTMVFYHQLFAGIAGEELPRNSNGSNEAKPIETGKLISRNC
ncbi:MAG: hypothetical protein R3C03_15115 [Pirellulaceae bacterium]